MIQYRKPMLEIDLNPNDVRRFWSMVDRRGESECWEWRGARSSAGYGRFRVGSKLLLTHRVSFVLAKGPIKKTRNGREPLILHSCDNPPCCNPAHVGVGFYRDNMREMDERGRRNQIRGANAKGAKLTEEAVREIRASALTAQALSERFAVSDSLIYLVRAGKAWAHVS